MTFLAELFALIAMAIVEIMVHLLAAVFASTWFSIHSKGAERTSNILFGFIALYFLLGLALPLTGLASPLLLSFVFSAPSMIIMGLLLFFSILFPMASKYASSTRSEENYKSTTNTNTSDPIVSAGFVIPTMLSYALAFLIVFVGLSIWAAQSERVSLRDQICDAAKSKLSTTWKERGAKAVSITEQLLKRDFHTNLPCADELGILTEGN